MREHGDEAEDLCALDQVAVDLFREPWPKGHDALFFSNVFHDWDFETCDWLAAQAFDAL